MNRENIGEVSCHVAYKSTNWEGDQKEETVNIRR